MKQLISKNGDYSVYVDISPVEYPEKAYALSFHTQLDTSKSSDETQQKFIMFLTDAELSEFQTTIGKVLS